MQLTLPKEWYDKRFNMEKDIDEVWCGEEPCIIEKFFEKEREKHPHLRSKGCMISCRCPKCRLTCL